MLDGARRKSKRARVSRAIGSEEGGPGGRLTLLPDLGTVVLVHTQSREYCPGARSRFARDQYESTPYVCSVLWSCAGIRFVSLSRRPEPAVRWNQPVLLETTPVMYCTRYRLSCGRQGHVN